VANAAARRARKKRCSDLALIFGFEVNLLELMVFFEFILIIAVAVLVLELRSLRKMMDEAYQIEKMHSEEKKK